MWCPSWPDLSIWMLPSLAIPKSSSACCVFSGGGALPVCPGLPQVAPMSVYACLGSDAAAIRDAFLTRLQSKIEDMRIKVMILEFLTVAVETQPGLIELFLNLEVKDGSDGSKVSLHFGWSWEMALWEVGAGLRGSGCGRKLWAWALTVPLQEFSLGVWSCLHVVLELIGSQQQDRYWCPPLLHRAAIAFLHALWQDRRDSAMLVLRTKWVWLQKLLRLRSACRYL